MEAINEVRFMGEVLRDANPISDGNGLRIVFCLKVPSKADPRKLVYVDCTAGPELFGQFDGYLERDETVLVEGSMSYRTFTTSAGERRTVPIIVADSVQVMEEDE